MNLNTKMKLARYLLLGLSFIMVNGCAANFPLTKENIITSPIHIEMPKTDGIVPKAKNDFVTEVLTGQDDYILDDIGRAKATEYVGNLYVQEFVDKKIPFKERVKLALEKALSQPEKYLLPNKYGTDKDYRLFGSLINWNENNGLAVVKAVSQWTSKYAFTGTANIVMNITTQMDKDTINFDITKLGYVLNCYFANDVTCNFESDFKINEDVLVSSLRGAYSAPDKTMSVASFRKLLQKYMVSRYSYSNDAIAGKITKTYHVDFTTAKSRLQRAMESFKYVDTESAFKFETTYTNPLNNSLSVEHKYVIALFPDKNETVIEFKGSYAGFRDTFGGPDLYSKNTYDAQLDEYIDLVSKILNK